MIDLKFFFNISRDVAMATNLVAKMGQNYLHPCTYRSVIPIQNLNVRIYSVNYASKSC